MFRLDRQRLENAAFPERIEVPVRFDDLDVQGHINNVAVAVLLQEGRRRFHSKYVPGLISGNRSLVVGSLFIDYAGALHYPDPVEISTGVLEIGRSFYVFGQIVRQGDAIAVFAEAAMIAREDERSAPLPDDARSALEEALIVSGPIPLEHRQGRIL